MSRLMNGAEMVVEALQDQGVDTVFGYPGGAVLPIYDALFQHNAVKHVLVRHEQGAAHAAEGYARSTGKVGVLLVTSGPGATNAVTGLTDALLDSIPLVCITGQVPTHLIGSDAFQECDTTGITRHCTKHNYLVRRIEDLPRILHEAFWVASHGRPGPVVIDIPKDVQFAQGTYVGPQNIVHKTYQPKVKGDMDRIRQAVAMMAAAKRPVFYTGGGVINAGPAASTLLRELVALTGFPGHLDPDGPRRLSGVGQGVARHARHARHLRGQPCHARLRSDDRGRVALRRPHHGPARRFLARLEEDPHRHRPVLHQQGRQGRPRHRGRLRVRARRHGPAVASRGPGADKAALGAWWKEIDGWRDRKSLAFRLRATPSSPSTRCSGSTS